MWADDALPIILPEKGKAHGSYKEQERERNRQQLTLQNRAWYILNTFYPRLSDICTYLHFLACTGSFQAVQIWHNTHPPLHIHHITRESLLLSFSLCNKNRENCVKFLFCHLLKHFVKKASVYLFHSLLDNVVREIKYAGFTTRIKHNELPFLNVFLWILFYTTTVHGTSQYILTIMMTLSVHGEIIILYSTYTVLYV